MSDFEPLLTVARGLYPPSVAQLHCWCQSRQNSAAVVKPESLRQSLGGSIRLGYLIGSRQPFLVTAFRCSEPNIVTAERRS